MHVSRTKWTSRTTLLFLLLLLVAWMCDSFGDSVPGGGVPVGPTISRGGGVNLPAIDAAMMHIAGTTGTGTAVGLDWLNGSANQGEGSRNQGVSSSDGLIVGAGQPLVPAVLRPASISSTNGLP